MALWCLSCSDRLNSFQATSTDLPGGWQGEGLLGEVLSLDTATRFFPSPSPSLGGNALQVSDQLGARGAWLVVWAIADLSSSHRIQAP